MASSVNSGSTLRVLNWGELKRRQIDPHTLVLWLSWEEGGSGDGGRALELPVAEQFLAQTLQWRTDTPYWQSVTITQETLKF